MDPPTSTSGQSTDEGRVGVEDGMDPPTSPSCTEHTTNESEVPQPTDQLDETGQGDEDEVATNSDNVNQNVSSNDNYQDQMKKETVRRMDELDNIFERVFQSMRSINTQNNNSVREDNNDGNNKSPKSSPVESLLCCGDLGLVQQQKQ